MKKFFNPKALIKSIVQSALLLSFFSGVVFAQTYVEATQADTFFEGIPSDLKHRINTAIPKKAIAEPLKTRKLLVFNLHVNKNREPLKGHNSIPYGNYAIWQMGEKTGAYQTYFSNDTLVFQREILKQFDAVCFNNTAGVLFDDPELRQSLLDFVYGGKGFIGIHAAGATFVQWPVYDQFPEFGRMLGGYESGGHPWKADKDLAISWIKDYGRGRVFYSALGDNNHIFWDIRVLHQNFAGIQAALGDLYAPATPNKKLTPSIISQEKLGWRLGMTAYSFKDLTLYETIDQTADLGLLYLGGLNVQKVSDEINKNFDPELSREELYTIRKKFRESGVKLVNYYIHDIPDNDKECRRIYEFGKLMGIETFISEPEPEALDLIEKYCEEYNIKLAIHNHAKDISPVYWDPENIWDLCRGRSALIGACGDIGYWMRSGIDPAKAISMLGDRLITVQMHDLDAGSPAGKDVPWGQGTLEVDKLMRLMMELTIKPSLIGVEYSRDWGNSLPQIRKSIDFFNTRVIHLAN